MYYNRILEEKIKKYISQNEIIAVIGPRQSGKTTMLKQILSTLENVNIVTLDDVSLLSLFQNDIKSFIELYIKDYDYVFIDEIQYAKESGKQLKYIYDTQKVKLFISGSSSAEVSLQSLKYLVGRIFIFKLYPFSFREFLFAQNSKIAKIHKQKNFGTDITKELQKYIAEFLTFGGYPRVILAEDDEEKKTVLQNIYNTLLLREVRDLFGISNNEKLIKLIKALSLQIGNLINYKELSNISGFSLPLLKKHIGILEELFICKRCYPFSKNPRTELVKNPKIYFIDLGLRNIIIDNFTKERTDKGAMYENLVFSEFLKKDTELKYWRTKSGAEIDFILNGEPIEIKTSPRTGKALYSFIKKYSPKHSYVISETEQEKIQIYESEVRFLSYPKFL